MAVQRNNDIKPISIYVQFELKANLGNYESAGFSVGYEVPPDTDMKALRIRIHEELFALGHDYLAGYDLPVSGQKAAGQVAISLKKGATK